MYRDAFKPGDTVAPGLYWVHHYQHRLTHLVRICLSRFPRCERCGDKVRFSPAAAADGDKANWLRLDPDFQSTSKDIPLQADQRNG